MVTALSKELPLLAAWKDDSGREWKKFELPGTNTESEQGPASESLVLSLQSRVFRSQRFEVELQGGLPRQGREDVEQVDEAEPDSWHIASAEAMELIDKHIDLVNRLYDETQSQDGADWQGRAEGLAVRPLGAVLESWRESGRRDEPRMALIVHLERDKEFRGVLSDVCKRPRRVLARRRQMQQIARIQEVDPACIRWMVRQPGVTLAQKAGTKQEALGVVRFENADTPENRVVRDLVRRAILACNRYNMENQRFPDRVRMIRRFRRELRAFLLESEIADVGHLVGMASPNYVLQHDPRYRVLWNRYVLLVRQKMQQDAVWRWRHRVWAEHTSLAIMASLEGIREEARTGASDVLVRAEQIAGRFIDPLSAPAPWHVTGEVPWEVVDFVGNGCSSEHPMIPSAMARLCPDFVLVRRLFHGKQPSSILGVWTMMDFDLEDDHLRGRTKSISECLRRVAAPCSLAGLLIQPFPPRPAGRAREMDAAERLCDGLRLPIDLQGELQELTCRIRSGLRIGGAR